MYKSRVEFLKETDLLRRQRKQFSLVRCSQYRKAKSRKQLKILSNHSLHAVNTAQTQATGLMLSERFEVGEKGVNSNDHGELTLDCIGY